jgi:hypothetical protein
MLGEIEKCLFNFPLLQAFPGFSFAIHVAIDATSGSLGSFITSTIDSINGELRSNANSDFIVFACRFQFSVSLLRLLGESRLIKADIAPEKLQFSV